MRRLKKYSSRLKERALNSLILAIELFNRPNDLGRAEAVLTFFHHAFEMLLKSAIYQKTGKIKNSGDKYNYDFKKCINIAKDDPELKIIDENGSRILSILNNLRNSAVHDYIEISEQNLYLHSQAVVTLFDDVLKKAFGDNISDFLPERVLPVSTNPPKDIDVFMDEEFTQILKLIRPNTRKRLEAEARLKPLLIVESSLSEDVEKNANRNIEKIITKLQEGLDWKTIFPEIATLKLNTAGEGLTYSVKITKNEGPPVRKFVDGDNPNDVTLYKEIHTLDRYSMTVTDLSNKLGITLPKTSALIEYLDLQSSDEYFKKVSIRSTTYNMYTSKALEKLKEEKENVNMDDVWKRYIRKHYGK